MKPNFHLEPFDLPVLKDLINEQNFTFFSFSILAQCSELLSPAPPPPPRVSGTSFTFQHLTFFVVHPKQLGGAMLLFFKLLSSSNAIF